MSSESLKLYNVELRTTGPEHSSIFTQVWAQGCERAYASARSNLRMEGESLTTYGKVTLVQKCK